ncbi:PPE family protein [Mycobacterium sp. MFM001]|uniref:PPE family protein n=1 Tax=Mycobacterium sp. MFM001 TaxID=2049453 RepID=UPI000E2FACC2|nr:PPE domain-containing protein [Mycobacterium sp. MFM001]
MLWHAMPPELNTARLMVGAGEEPMLQAAAGWEAFAAALEAQAAELAAALAALSGAWTGMGSETGVAACMPMVVWLQTVAAQAQKRAAQATAQAAAYATAMATTPPLPEIMQNRITTPVLYATNFFGVNTVPIAVYEEDYWVRMWNQAAGAMDAYQAETMTNVMFEPIMPMKPIVIPGIGEGVLGAALGQSAAGVAGAVMRDAVFTHVTGQATIESVGLNSGKGVDLANMAATDAQGAARIGENAGQTATNQSTQQTQAPQQVMQQAMQIGTQVGSQAMQIPQQLASMVSSPMQQLTQPLQQVTSMFTSMGSGMGSHDQGMQLGLVGASALSNHPMVGGTGPSAGAGLMRAASLPGMSGSPSRTPLLAKLIDKVDTTPAAVEPVGAAAGASATAGAAPVGGSGGAPPMGLGQAPKSGGTKAGLKAPAPLAQDLGEEEGDDW